MFEEGDRVEIVDGRVADRFGIVIKARENEAYQDVRVKLLDRYQAETLAEGDLVLRPGIASEELDFDTVELLGLDGTGRDWNPYHPFTYGNVKQGIAWVRENGWNV